MGQEIEQNIIPRYIQLLEKEDQDVINRASLLDAKTNAFIFALITFLTIIVTIIPHDKLIMITTCNKYYTILLCVLVFIILVFVLLTIILFALLNNYSIKDYKRTGFEDGFDLKDETVFENKIIEDYKKVISYNGEINENKAKKINKLIYLETIFMIVMIVLVIILNILVSL